MSDKNRFANLPIELTSEDISKDIMEAITKLTEKQSSDHKQVMDKLNSLDDLIQRVHVLEENYKKVLPLIQKFPQIEKDISAIKVVNTNLKTEMESYKSEIKLLKIKLDDREQHSRNECVRINGVQVDKDLEKSLGHNQAAMKAVEEVLKPLLEANKNRLKMPTEPGQFIKNAHILPIPKDKNGSYKVPPIIVRFHSRPLKDFILSNKKNLPIREIDVKNGVDIYSISADLTKMRYYVMQKLIRSKQFSKCWHLDGRVIKYIKNEGDRIQSVKFFDKSCNELMNN